MLCVNIDKLYELQGEMNETQMAKKLGISRSQLWRIKTGHSSVGQEFIAKFKKSFPEIRIDDIFFVSDDFTLPVCLSEITIVLGETILYSRFLSFKA